MEPPLSNTAKSSGSAVRVAVIGSAGRNRLIRRVNAKDYKEMCAELVSVLGFLRKESGKEAVSLVSGGSALSDHVAVSLFLVGTCKKLELFLPADFSVENNLFDASRSGKSLHNHHMRFSDACGVESLRELSNAMRCEGLCSVKSFSGFAARNKALAASSPEYAVVFGFDRADKVLVCPEDECEWAPTGGSRQTWRALRKAGSTLLYIPIKRYAT